MKIDSKKYDIYVFSEGYASHTLNGGLEKYLLQIYNNFSGKKFVEYFTLSFGEENDDIKTIDNVDYVNSFTDIESFNLMSTFVNGNEKSVRRMRYSEKYARILSANQFNYRNMGLKGKKILFNCDLNTIGLINPQIIKDNDCYFVDHGMMLKYLLIAKKINQSNTIGFLNLFAPIWFKYYRFSNKFEKAKSFKRYNNHSMARNLNLVTYTKYDKKIWEKFYDFKKIYTFELAEMDSKKENHEQISWENKNYDLSYLGRYSEFQKGMKTLNDIFEKNKKITGCVAGYDFIHLPGESYIKAKNIDNIGRYDGKKEDFFQKSKYSILTSKFEGYGFSLVESIKSGIPVIVLDNFPAARAIVGENNERGFLAKSPKKMRKWIKKNINNKDLWLKKVEACKEYSENSNNWKKFSEGWGEIIN